MSEDSNQSKKITVNSIALRILEEFALPNEKPSDTNLRILIEYSKRLPVDAILIQILEEIRKGNTQLVQPKIQETEVSFESKVLNSLKGTMNVYEIMSATGIAAKDLKMTLALLVKNNRIYKTAGGEYRRSTN